MSEREAAIRDGSFREEMFQEWDTYRREAGRAALDFPSWVLAELAAAREREERAEREAAEQMGSKLEAQMALAAITEALDLKLVELGNGWTEGAKAILARIETIVDEADRGFRERDEARERERLLREALRAAPMPVRESTLKGENWHERYDEWWHGNASEAALDAAGEQPTTREAE